MTSPDPHGAEDEGGSGDLPPADHRALYAPFRPRYARVVVLTLAVVVVVLAAALIVALPGFAPDSDPLGDQLGVGLVAIGVVWFCWRQAAVRAEVDEQGVLVRNLLFSRRLEWPEVVLVRFGQGRPWVQLDLADGDTIAVMGVQRADGAFAVREAERLATLVALHSRTSRDD
ncbi:PH domain-containing protein [Cellulomonas sp. P22]|uniref:PH domain-containing protein n=1 Tax=Cellulomonas sp. P22 TaxID=3373189 RepID=UPI0037B56CAD